MNRWEKTHWILVLAYNGLLCFSLVAVLKVSVHKPLHGYAFLTLTFGSTIGTIVLVGVTLVHMAGKRISVAAGLGVIALLVVVSFVCLVLAFPHFQY